MNEIRGQGILQNTESGGIGFESTGSGYVELWAHIEVAINVLVFN